MSRVAWNAAATRIIAALVLLVGIVLLPLRAVAATIPTVFAYDVAVRPPGTTALGGEDAERPEAEPSGINDYDGARLAYIGVSNPYGVAGVGVAAASVRKITLRNDGTPR